MEREAKLAAMHQSRIPAQAIIPPAFDVDVVDDLWARVAAWKRQWLGMNLWDEQRKKYVTSTLDPVEVEDYKNQLSLGNDLLDECYVLLTGPGQQIEGMDAVINLARRIITVAIVLSTGLERLRVNPVVEDSSVAPHVFL
jgi:hypothetical protein